MSAITLINLSTLSGIELAQLLKRYTAIGDHVVIVAIVQEITRRQQEINR